MLSTLGDQTAVLYVSCRGRVRRRPGPARQGSLRVGLMRPNCMPSIGYPQA